MKIVKTIKQRVKISSFANFLSISEFQKVYRVQLATEWLLSGKDQNTVSIGFVYVNLLIRTWIYKVWF